MSTKMNQTYPIHLSKTDLYDIYPSKLGRSYDYTTAITLTVAKSIFNDLREQVGQTSRGDYDGERVETDFDLYHVEAVRRYETYKDVDGSGAPLLDIRRDDIEIVNVTDFEYGEMSFPAVVDKLNYYGKHNNL